ncbi:hypothetical protein IEQ34_023100 [Dendrobium chrysotoxum]|uniref:Bifunctional inhibitor/plant lipid transfer protein/seed storage helical domain-containing protein n=1 Tax=Dendrobium chrysotoxum TaxID=161865 RepID=A0AAV7G0W2_DENCH|nr:hypothetical protein IEQ34_023100 [Dendrobium chrysotoxum]
MKSPSLLAVCIALSAALLLLCGEPSAAVVVKCDPSELRVCAGAIMWSMSPSTKCCEKLKEQEPCFCQYMNDPDLSGYIKSENAKKLEEKCVVSLPKTCLEGSEGITSLG